MWRRKKGIQWRRDFGGNWNPPPSEPVNVKEEFSCCHTLPALDWLTTLISLHESRFEKSSDLIGRLVLSRNDMLALMSQLIVWKPNWSDQNPSETLASLCIWLQLKKNSALFQNEIRKHLSISLLTILSSGRLSAVMLEKIGTSLSLRISRNSTKRPSCK